MTATRPEPTMLWPKARQYPFDEICEQIARALEARNWDIPGLEVSFRTYGSGDETYRYLSEVAGEDFVLKYGRPQGRPGYFNDVAAIRRIAIPHRALEVFEDGSGPSYVEYTGHTWTEDRHAFLRYAYGTRADRIAFQAYYGRLMTRLDNFPVYQVADVYHEFTTWLEEKVLPIIEAYPFATADYSRFDVADIPFPSILPRLFCFAEREDGRRILQGQADPSLLPPHERYALQQAMRWVPLGVGMRDNPIPEAAYDGFVWCGFGSVDENSVIDELSIPGHSSWGESIICRVTPNRANDIYVGDQAAFDRKREELWNSAENRAALSDRELNLAFAARGHAFVPITKYDGSFTQPVVLIGRELGFDEVELVTPFHRW